MRTTSVGLCGMLPLDDLLRHSGLPPASEPNATLSMSLEEAQTLLGVLLRRVAFGQETVYVEWGSGGSTELVAYLLNTRRAAGLRAYSIESSTEWMSLMRQRTPLVLEAERSGALRFLHGDLGDVGALGFPLRWRPSDRTRALRYVSLSQIPERRIDIVLDDGRFRLACALEALSYLRPASTLILHDFDDEVLDSDTRRPKRSTYHLTMSYGFFR